MGKYKKFGWNLVIVSCLVISVSSAGSASRYESYGVQEPTATDTQGYYHGNYGDIHKKSTTSDPPTTDQDYQQIEDRRGAFDRHGRSLIFKSLILAPLALVVIILLIVILVPIPVISAPLAGRRSITNSLSWPSAETLKTAKDVLTSEECVERVSCELSRISRSYDSTSWIPSTLEKVLVRSKWGDRIVRGMKGTEKTTCSHFSCTPAKNLRRSFKNAVGT